MPLLSPDELRLVRNRMGVLIGEPLSDMWRYAGNQVFNVGPDAEMIDAKGTREVIAKLALVISCEWTFSGPAGFRLANSDFGPGDERRDAHALRFYALSQEEPIALEKVRLEIDASLYMDFTKGYILEVRPAVDPSPWEDQWRLQITSNEDAGTLVVGATAVRWFDEAEIST